MSPTETPQPESLLRHSDAQVRTRLLALALILTLLGCICPLLAQTAYRGSADLHAAIEIIGSLLGLIAGFALVARFCALGNRFYLLVGLAFFVNGAEDFVHGLLSFAVAYGLTGMPASSLEQFIPGTYVTGRICMGMILLMTPLASSAFSKSGTPGRETIWASTAVLLVTVAMTAAAFRIPLPMFLHPDLLIPRLADFVSAIVFFFALMVFVRLYRYQSDPLTWWITLSIGIHLVGQLVMSFSARLFDLYFDIAHAYKVLGYAVPLLGFCLCQIASHARQVEAENVRGGVMKRLKGVNRLQEELISSRPLEQQLQLITDKAIAIFDLDFCRIWHTKPADLCDAGCVHAAVTDGPHVCRRRDKCLHLIASSGRYTHLDGDHRRVPLGCYKIGLIATGKGRQFLTNDVTRDPRVHNHEWAEELGLRSFAGFRLRDESGSPIGVLAMFAKHPICEHDASLMWQLAEATSRAILECMAKERLRTLSQAIEQSPASVVITDTEGTIQYVNPKFTRVTGYAAHEAIGQTPRIMKSGHTPAETYDELWKTITSGRDWQGELYDRRKNGELYWASARISPVVGHDDAITHFVGVAEDVTERKRTERELVRSETRYRKLYDSTSDAVMLLDDRGFFDCNNAAAAMFGCKGKAELCTKHPADLSPPEQPCGTDSSTLASRRIAVAMEEGTNRFEWMHKRLDTGEVFPVDVLLNAVELGGRRVLQVVVRDISERKQVEDKLVDARETAMRESAKLRSMIQGMDEGVVLADADDVVTDVNNWFLDKTGLKREDIVGKSLWDLHPDTEAAARVRASLATFRDGRKHQPHVVNRELLGMHVSLRVQPIFKAKRYEGVILNVIDVTDLAEARRAAESANYSKSCFLANMSHEIRTPMTAILGFAEILLNKIEDPEALEAAGIVKRNGEHLLELINDILDISKIEAGRMEFERIPWSPRQIVTEVVSLLHVRAQAKGLTLKDEYEGALPETIVTDPTRLRQVLMNVVGNAIKFTETGGVRIVTRLTEGNGEEPKLRFDVIDTGVGIREAEIENVFKAFSQGDGSVTRQYGGTGLGLAISRQLARLLGGDVTATSEPGQGSTFTVVVGTGALEGVPLVDGALQTVRGGEDRKMRAPKDERKLQCRILLAEDIPDNQRLIGAVLRRAGAEVTIAQDGQQAWEKAMATQPGWGKRYSDPEEAFDVVLMDMQMPILDGYEATRRLRREGHAGPIIALTAHAMQGDRDKCLEAGCDDYLTKPIDPERIVETVARWAGRQQPTEGAAGNERGGEEATGDGLPAPLSGQSPATEEDHQVHSLHGDETSPKAERER